MILSEKIIKQVLTGAIQEVVDPLKNYKKIDCEKAVAITEKVMDTLKELGLYKSE
jgi:HEPN domain-containing protein